MIRTNCFDEITKKNKLYWESNKKIVYRELESFRLHKEWTYGDIDKTVKDIIDNVENTIVLPVNYLLQIRPGTEQKRFNNQHFLNLYFLTYNAKVNLYVDFDLKKEINNTIEFSVDVRVNHTQFKSKYYIFENGKIDFDKVNKMFNYKNIIEITEYFDPKKELICGIEALP